jgi:hypothetical protein
VIDGVGWARLLWWWVLDEVDALLDITLEAFRTSRKELLLLFGDVLKDVGGFLGAIGLFGSISVPY